jgi:two-component system, OmpR family, sensor histidine kinase TctE
MAKLTIDVVQDCLPRAMDKRIDLGYEGPEASSPNTQLHGNPTLIKELIRNLLDNAINYTPSSPERTGVVTARVLADSYGNALVLQVEDNGPGIAQAERALVLQPFYRTLGSDVDGSGLGLAIVAEIAQQHGATLAMEDTHPKHTPPGTRFTLRFKKSSGLV